MATSIAPVHHPTDSPYRKLFWRPLVAVIVRIALNVVGFLILFQTYKVVRQTFIQRAREIGFDNAERVIAFEQRLHVFFEPSFQQRAISHEWLIKALNWTYFSFMFIFLFCCGLAIAFARSRFRHLRRVFLFSMLLALPWYALFPLAPPRFMPAYGLVDTLQLFGPIYDSGDGLVKANQFAAMPSMHIGWTTIGAFMLAAAIPKWRIGAILGAFLVGVMCLTVMATGNHYVADIVGGWIVVAFAFLLTNLSERIAPSATSKL